MKACGGFTLRVPAGSQIDLACGSIIITVGPGGPLVIEVDGEKELSIEIPSGVSVRVSTPVNDDFTVEYLSGSQPVIVREPSEPWDLDYPSPRETWISSGTRSFTTNLPPTVDSVSLSTANVVIGQQVELTATFSDPGVDDTHTCAVTWASGVTVPGTVSAGQCTSSHSYGALGLNNVIVRVTDDAGDAGSGGASVLVYDPDTYWTYDPSSSFGGAGGGIDVDPVSQDVWITGNNKVAKYSSDGTLQFEVGGFGTAPGLFNGASALAVHPSTGDVYVTDVGGNRIQQFDSNGNFVPRLRCRRRHRLRQPAGHRRRRRRQRLGGRRLQRQAAEVHVDRHLRQHAGRDRLRSVRRERRPGRKRLGQRLRWQPRPGAQDQSRDRPAPG